MSETLAVHLLAFPAPACLLVLVMAIMSGGDESRRRTTLLAATVAALSLMAVAIWHGGSPQTPAPAPSPSAVVSDALQECYAIGGVQMVYVDGAWRCVTADQAG